LKLTILPANFIQSIRNLFNPNQFQGAGKERRYFEGWYFKVVSQDEAAAFAVIPGIAMDETGRKQAFIQVLDGKLHTSLYHQFDFESFAASKTEFRISIGNNSFTEKYIDINLPGMSGRLEFSNLVPWPKPFYSPGIMGPYAFVPFMECYHGIVSMDHSVSGKLTVDGQEIDFGQGRGYTEKDWGRSFPSAYVWMQSNHFSLPGISVKASVARIPWIRNAFVGFIAGVWLHDRLIRFTTYNGSALKQLQINDGKVALVLENKRHHLSIIVRREAATSLASPIRGMMDGRIEESMTSSLEVVLTDKKTGQIVLEDTGRNGGLEVAGKISEIVK
jgi:tocopherol cyclase